MNYAKNFYHNLSVTQALGLGVVLTMLVTSLAYPPYMSAYNGRIVAFVRAQMVPIHQQMMDENTQISILRSQLAAVRHDAGAENGAR